MTDFRKKGSLSTGVSQHVEASSCFCRGKMLLQTDSHWWSSKAPGMHGELWTDGELPKEGSNCCAGSCCLLLDFVGLEMGKFGMRMVSILVRTLKTSAMVGEEKFVPGGLPGLLLFLPFS